MAGIVLFASFATLLVGTVLILDRRHDPLRRLSRFRVRDASGIRFERLGYATIGDTPTKRAFYRHTLSFALDAEWLYLRHSRAVPFIPAFWRLPRRQIRPLEDVYWTIRITACEPALNGDFGPEFLNALKSKAS
jgi:hypothetical protein